MKQTIYGMAGGFVLIFVLMILMALYGRDVRQTEVQNALADAVNAALSQVKKEDIGKEMDVDAFVANFMQALLVQVNSSSDVAVKVLEAEPKMGILSVEVTEKYRHPNGNTGAVSAVRTVIFDKEEKPDPKYYTVSYYIDGNKLYKSYTKEEGTMTFKPRQPEKEGKRFQGWRFRSGGSGMATFTENTLQGGRGVVLSDSGGRPICLSGNISLEAIFE